MLQFVLRRALLTIPLLIGMTICLFVVFEFTPGNPADIALGELATAETIAQLEKAWGLSDPLYVQIPQFLINAVRGDLGFSFMTQRPVASEIARTFPNTMVLALSGLFVATIVGIPLGVVAATKQGSMVDTLSMIVALLGLSVPVFVTGLVFMYIFAYRLNWFPVAGQHGFSSLVLPAIALGLPSAAEIARMTRSSMLEQLSLDYLRTARAKGLGERQIVYLHAFRNASIPIVTLLGLRLGHLLAGTVVIETIFSWPGLGSLILEAVLFRDYPLIRSSVLFIAVVFVAVNLVVDVLYGFIDPRIRFS
jgi:peptide/nickel transport system permease protein